MSEEKKTIFEDKEKESILKRQQNQIFYSLLLAISFENLLWMTIIFLFPIFISKHHPSISTMHVGMILSVFHLTTLVVTPFVGQYLHVIGRKNALVFSYVLATIAAVGYSTLAFVQNTYLIYIIAIIIRVIEGVTTSLNQTAVYAIAPLEFPDHKERTIGFLEMGAGLGLTIGPFISGIIYSYLHYTGTFIFFAVILAVTGVFLQYGLPRRMNSLEYCLQDDDDEDEGSNSTIDDEEEESKKKRQPITYWIFFQTRETTFVLLAACVCMLSLYHFETILSVHLTTAMGMDEDNLGFFFCAQSFCYALFSYLTSLISNKDTNSYLIVLGFVMSFVGNVLLGPSEYFYLPQEVWVMGVGLAILGMAGPLIFIPILPELITLMNDKFRHLKDNPKLMDMSSGIYGTAENLGFWLTPLFSGTVFDYFGYHFTCDLMAGISLFFAGFFYFFIIFAKKKKRVFEYSGITTKKQEEFRIDKIIDEI